MSCTAYTLKGITNDCSTSKGGIREIYIADWQKDIFTVGDSAGTVTALKSETQWYKYYIKKFY